MQNKTKKHNFRSEIRSFLRTGCFIRQLFFERATHGNLIGWTFEIRVACFEYAWYKRFQYNWDYF